MEDYCVPLEGINSDVEEVLRVLRIVREACTRCSGYTGDLEHHGHGANLVGGLVFRHADQVFVKVLGRLSVLCDGLLVLVERPTEGKELEEFENEFVLVLGLLELRIVLVFFVEKTSAQLVATLNAIDPLGHASLKVCCVGTHDAKVFQEVKVGHVYYTACHLLETKIGNLSERGECRNSLTSWRAVEKCLQEVISANSVEHLVVSELSHPEGLIQHDTPERKDW